MDKLHRYASALTAILFSLHLGCTETSRTPVVPESPILLAGGYGEGTGQFHELSAAAMVGPGLVVVADNGLGRLTWLERVAEPRHVAWSTVPYSALVTDSTTNQQIRTIHALAASPDTLYIAGPGGIWALRGDHAELAASGSLPERIYSLAWGEDEKLYVLGDNQVVVVGKEGELLTEWTISEEDSPGARKIAVGPDGNLYIVANRWRQVLVFAPDGREVQKIGQSTEAGDQFRGTPRAIGPGPDGTLYIYDNSAPAMKVIDSSAVEYGSFATRGSKQDEALTVTEILVDRAEGVLLLVDSANYRLQVFDLFGRDESFVDLVKHDPTYPASPTPDHLALTFGKSPLTERVLTWRTDSSVQKTRVQLQEKPSETGLDGVDWSSSSVREVEGKQALVPSNLGPYLAHETTLTDLRGGRRYIYRVGDGEGNWSRASYFEMPTNVDRNLRTVVLGDSRNRMDIWNDIINTSAKYLPAFIINTGDLVANGDDMVDWNMWFHEARDVLGRIPLMPCLGNHERNSPNYYHAFALPSNSNPLLEEQTYSFDYGPAHWVVLNSEFDLEAQAEWLEEDLSRTDKPWIFTFYHRPAYAGHPSRGDGNEDIREAWEQIFIDYGVDIAWQGHDHYYFRTKPVRNAEVVSEGQGPLYVTTGGSGAPLYPIEANQYMEVGESVDHYCVVDLTPDSCQVTVFRIDGSQLDHFTIRPRPKG